MFNNDERELDYVNALKLVELFEQIANWHLAPQYDGVFIDDKAARNYIESNPGHPLMVVFPLKDDNYSESVLVHHDGVQFLLDDDSMGGPCGACQNVDEIPAKIMEMFPQNIATIEPVS